MSSEEPGRAPEETVGDTPSEATAASGEHRPDDVEHDPDGLDLARALTRAVARIGGTPARKRSSRPRRSTGKGRVSGAHPDERDPQTLDATLSRLVGDHGWDLSLRVHGVFGRWSQIVGEECGAPPAAATADSLYFVPFLIPGDTMPVQIWTPDTGLRVAGNMTFSPQPDTDWGDLDPQAMNSIVGRIAPKGKVLLVDAPFSVEAARATRNIESVSLQEAAKLNTLDLCHYQKIVVSTKALEAIIARVNGGKN